MIMSTDIIKKIEQEQSKTEVPDFSVGDAVKVHVKIKEGGKERLQVFPGTVIARQGGGLTETFTVRRISHSVGVERVFPIHSPSVEKIEVERSSNVRQAKLFFLRGRSGKAARLKERRK